MPDYPQAARDKGAAALCELHHLDPEWAAVLASRVLDACADTPELAEMIVAAVNAAERRRPVRGGRAMSSQPMTVTGNMAEPVRAFLRSQGWAEGEAGRAGTLWTSPATAEQVAVAHQITYGSLEWRSVLDSFPGMTRPEIAARILHPGMEPEMAGAYAALEFLASQWSALNDGAAITGAGWRVMLDPADTGSGKPARDLIRDAAEVEFWAVTRRNGREITTRRPAKGFLP